jgi:hypothetical protein
MSSSIISKLTLVEISSPITVDPRGNKKLSLRLALARGTNHRHSAGRGDVDFNTHLGRGSLSPPLYWSVIRAQ